MKTFFIVAALSACVLTCAYIEGQGASKETTYEKETR